MTHKALLDCPVHLFSKLAMLLIVLSILSFGKSFADITPLKNTSNKSIKTAKIEFPFISNNGQLKDEKVRFYARTPNGDIYVEESGELYYYIPGISENKISGCMIREWFDGASSFNLKGQNISATKISFLSRKFPTKSRNSISAFNTISLG